MLSNFLLHRGHHIPPWSALLSTGQHHDEVLQPLSAFLTSDFVVIFSNVKIRYFIFLEDSNKTCDSSNTSATTTSTQPNLENSSGSELSSSQSDSAKAADDPGAGESDSHTPVSAQEEIGKSTQPLRGEVFLCFFFL